MFIRPATQKDITTLLDFEQKIIATERPMDPTLIQNQPISYYPLEKYIDANDVEVLVAENQGQIVGSIYGHIKPRKAYFQNSHIGYIGFIYIRKSYRGQGLCQSLVENITSWFKQQGVSDIILQVYAQNRRAIQAYEKIGFNNHIIEMRLKEPQS